MAIYHLNANIISRARGQSAVAAAAYRMGAVLRDERFGVTHNYVGKRGVTHSELMAPRHAPPWALEREALWNRVEACELRKDSQLARLLEVGLPIELDADERAALMRDFVAQEFVAEGMIADFAIRGSEANPHAHVLLTLRRVTASGFGPKERRWNGKSLLLEWRSAWATLANLHLARAGHAVRIDHRTLAAQRIELTPGRRIGVGRARRDDRLLPDHLSERIAEQQRIASENGELILADPTVALRALTHQRPSFTHRELVSFLRARTHGAVQLAAVLAAVTQSGDLTPLAAVAGEERFTSRDTVEAEESLLRRCRAMAARRGHGVRPAQQGAAQGREVAVREAARRDLAYLVGDGDAKALAVTDEIKAPLLRAAHQAWAEAGWVVRGAAPSPRAAAHLQAISGIESHALSRYEEEWQRGGALQPATVLLLDGAELCGIKQLERVVAAADKARAAVVLMADTDRLRAMKVATPFRDVLQGLAPGRDTDDDSHEQYLPKR